MKAAGTETKTSRSDEIRWHALVTRKANDEFLYGVRSTGVYCRPGCAARLPKRHHVVFFETCAAAELAGFRPCKRCTPNGKSLQDQHAHAIELACRHIESAEESPTLEAVARAAGLSVFHFHRIFKEVTGLTPKAYAKARRAERVRKALAGSATVTEAIYAAGFSASSRFYDQSREMLGMAPRQFHRGAKGESIRYAISQCALGKILVAKSGIGICAILLGDDPERLATDLRAIFPKAQVTLAGPDLQQALAQVTEFINEPKRSLKLPLDIRGTAFQQRVWRALAEIPAGKTLSYREVAKRMGSPKAIRAVGRACAANVLAVAVPCHRVVRSDGTISDYRWGPDRKSALLRQEKS